MRTLGLFVVGLMSVLLLGSSAGAKVRCGRTSRCTEPATLAEVRAAVREACPCDRATSPKTWKKCWKPVVKQLAGSLGKQTFPKACRADATRALVNSTCGRAGAALCRGVSRKGAETCRIAKATRCNDPYDLGAISSCAALRTSRRRSWCRPSRRSHRDSGSPSCAAPTSARTTPA